MFRGHHALLSTSLLLWFVLAVQGQLSNLTVDLNYGLYTGVFNNVSGLNVWKGVRYAAPPIGALRWQAPQLPVTNRTRVIASTAGPACPQAYPSFPGVGFTPGNEDCLYLNVFSPAKRSTNGTKLPVMVMIHGGGYGEGDASTDMTGFINANDNGLIVVVIQYRLGAFGFLSSAEVKDRGVLNAGLLDQNFALQWVQKHIAKFGGDPNQVTITGESSGGGSVMLHAMARGGTLGTTLFKNLIAASPFLPSQYNYSDAIPTEYYESFATSAGCSYAENVFDCLVGKDSLTLQYAGNAVSATLPPHGNWAFIPVTDGTYVTGLPSVQLNQRKVNGLRALLGNNADEGALLVPSTIVEQSDVTEWITTNYPNLSQTNITQILAAYPSSSGPVEATTPRYATSGLGPATALNVSPVATGQQQRAYNIYAEACAACPSYWMANAFIGPNRTSYHYQYSVPFAVHGSDLSAYYGPAADNQGPEFVTAFRKIYGNFVKTGNPSISNSVANGASALKPNASNPASAWPIWTTNAPKQINLNETGGVPYTTVSATGATVIQYKMPGLKNDFKSVDAYSWEGGRGQRCEFWRKLSPFVPQ